jgi:hypothetical protein
MCQPTAQPQQPRCRTQASTVSLTPYRRDRCADQRFDLDRLPTLTVWRVRTCSNSGQRGGLETGSATKTIGSGSGRRPTHPNPLALTHSTASPGSSVPRARSPCTLGSTPITTPSRFASPRGASPGPGDPGYVRPASLSALWDAAVVAELGGNCEEAPRWRSKRALGGYWAVRPARGSRRLGPSPCDPQGAGVHPISYWMAPSTSDSRAMRIVTPLKASIQRRA